MGGLLGGHVARSVSQNPPHLEYPEARVRCSPWAPAFVPDREPPALTDEIVKSLRHQVNQHVRPGAPHRAFA